MTNIRKSVQAYEDWMGKQLGREMVAKRHRAQAREDAGEPLRLSARHLLALGGDDPGGLPRPGGRDPRSRRRRYPPRELRHLARRRRPAGVGRQRLRRGGADALRAGPRAAGGERIAGKSRRGGAAAQMCAAVLDGLRPRAARAAGRSCSTAIGPGCASCWSSPTSSAPSSGARSRTPSARRRRRPIARLSPTRCRSRVSTCGPRAGSPAPAASDGRAGSALPNGKARRSCAS